MGMEDCAERRGLEKWRLEWDPEREWEMDNNWSMAKRQAEREAGIQQEPRPQVEAGRALETVEIRGWGKRKLKVVGELEGENPGGQKAGGGLQRQEKVKSCREWSNPTWFCLQKLNPKPPQRLSLSSAGCPCSVAMLEAPTGRSSRFAHAYG